MKYLIALFIILILFYISGGITGLLLMGWRYLIKDFKDRHRRIFVKKVEKKKVNVENDWL